MAMEFPSDPLMLQHNNGSAYQFMAGESFLVAPVYEDSVVRDGIYLPAGLWYDYWTGTEYTGPMTLDNYSAPLDILPIFVKAGAIVPMWPDMLFFDEKPHDPITLDIYPAGDTSFDMYEDDGVTRQAIDGGTAFAKTLISVTSPPPPGPGMRSGKNPTGGPINVTVAPAVGTYTGMPKTRGWMLQVHYDKRAAPKDVFLGDQVLPRFQSKPAMNYAEAGWFMQPDQPEVGSAAQRGTVFVKIPEQQASAGFTVSLSSGPVYPQLCLIACDTILHHQVLPQKFTYIPTSGNIVHTASGMCLAETTTDDAGSHTPEVAFETCSTNKKADNQKWVYGKDTMNFVSGTTGRCMDQDRSDMHVEMYGCGKKQTNQQWILTPNNTQHIQAAGPVDLCMSPCPADDSARRSAGAGHTPADREAMRRRYKEMYARDLPAH
jgi:hypothetical protein